MEIRILIADDHIVFRQALRKFLEKERDFKVVGEAGDGQTTLELVTKIEYDVLLLDISMPGGISAVKIVDEVVRKSKEHAIVVLTMYDDEYYVKELLKAGVKGFVLKKSTGETLIEAIRSVNKKRSYLDPSLSNYLIPSYTGKPAENNTNRLSILTQREQEICRLLALGNTNLKIAERLFISPRTVETHRTNIMRKLGLTSRAELVRFSIDNNLLKLR